MQAAQSDAIAPAAAPPPPPPREQAVLVLGATGRVGRKVVQKVRGGGLAGRASTVGSSILCMPAATHRPHEPRSPSVNPSVSAWLPARMWRPVAGEKGFLLRISPRQPPLTAPQCVPIVDRSCLLDGGGCSAVRHPSRLPLHPAYSW